MCGTSTATFVVTISQCPISPHEKHRNFTKRLQVLSLGSANGVMVNMPAPPKRLSCDRCRAQKLRCPRQGLEGSSCSRCVRRGASCVYSSPLPKGRPRMQRPSETHTDTSCNSWLSNRSSDGRTESDEWSAPKCNDGDSECSSDDEDGSEVNSSLSISRILSNSSAGVTFGFNQHTNDANFPSQRTWNDPWFAGQNEATAVQQNYGQPDLHSERLLDLVDTSQDFSQHSVDLTQASRRLGHFRTKPERNVQRSTGGGSGAQGISYSARLLDCPICGNPALNRAPQPPHLESCFWASIPGQEQIRNDIVQSVYERSYPIQIAWCDTLKRVPSKNTCDLLLCSFSVAVRPAYPLVNISVFQKEYDKFWSDHKSGHGESVDHAASDPTFIPLLFSILYCGAVAAPTAFCLVASVLGRSCSRVHKEASEDLSYVNTVVRLAQTLGLHRKHAGTELNAVTRETYRRVWWQIVGLNTVCSLRYGSKTCCGLEGDQWDTEMMSEVSDEAVLDFQPHCFTSVPAPVSNTSSVFMLFSIGRYEALRFTHGLLSRVNGCRRMDKDDLKLHLDAYKRLHIKITTLINRMPTQGVPEKGFVPYRVIHASILTHENLYSDRSEEPSTFTSWARITLTMLLKSSLLGLWKVLLSYPKLIPEAQLWISISRLSIDVIRHLLQIVRVPSFEPFFWFVTTDVSLYQAILITLTYLKLNPSCPDSQTATYFIDEAFDILGRLESRNNDTVFQPSGVPTPPEDEVSRQQTVLATLKCIRNKLKFSSEIAHVSATTSEYLNHVVSNAFKSPTELGSDRDTKTTSSDAPSLPQPSQHASSTIPSHSNEFQKMGDTTPRAGCQQLDGTSLDFQFGYFPPFPRDMDIDASLLCAPSGAAPDLLEFTSWPVTAMMDSEDSIHSNVFDGSLNTGEFLSDKPLFRQRA